MTAMFFRLLAPALLLLFASGQDCLPDGSVCDTHERCPVWAEQLHCVKNKNYMMEHCPASCATFRPNQPEESREEEEGCKDRFENCSLWAKANECEENVNVRRFCPESCGRCARDRKLVAPDGSGVKDHEYQDEDNECLDGHEQCAYWESLGECVKNPPYMQKHCKKSCGTCPQPLKKKDFPEADKLIKATAKFGTEQKAEGNELLRTLQVIEDSIAYMENEIEDLPESIVAQCQNRHELCAFWSAISECSANEAFMLSNCAPSCRSCHLIDIEARCPPLKDAQPALRPGDLNKMFERIVETAPGNATLSEEKRRELTEKQIPNYTLHVLSRPSEEPATEVDSTLEMTRPPWVLVLDNFLTPEECQILIDWGYKNGYERSRDVGKAKFDGSFDAKESMGRTSENSWCSAKSGCRQDENVQRIMNRMSFIMNISPDNSEDLQMLRYEINQFYNAHHDYIPYQRDRQCGPRILTFFLYLTDVEAGGGTRFTNLNITVAPKVGRALLWPSVRDSDPKEVDHRTRHEALPVEAGTKFGANGWIHLYDYIGPNARGCS